MDQRVISYRIEIYAICNHATGEAYIGQTRNGVAGRWKVHRQQLTRSKHPNRALQAAWRRDGERAFGLVVLDRQGWEAPFGDWEARIDHEALERSWLTRARAAGVVLYNDQVGRRKAA